MKERLGKLWWNGYGEVYCLIESLLRAGYSIGQVDGLLEKAMNDLLCDKVKVDTKITR